MSILNVTKDDTVAIITMTNGENRHNPTFAAEMLKALDEIEKDETVTSVVIASSDAKNWSQGIDVPWLSAAFAEKRSQDIKGFLYGMNEVFKRILLYPVPVIAAINGHAFGNGSILACVCDFRFMKSDRGFFCFPEIDINIPFLPGMIAIIKKAFPYDKLNEAVFSGKRMGGKELEAHHVVVKACENDEALMKEAISYAKTYKKGRPIFREMKRRFHKGIVEVMDREDPEYIESGKLMM